VVKQFKKRRRINNFIIKQKGMDNLQEAYLSVYQELDEASPSNPNLYKGRHGQSEKEYQADRSPTGKRTSGDEETGPRYYTLGRSRGATPDAPTQPGQRPVGTPKLADWEKKDIQYRRANLRAGKVHKVGGPKGLPEETDLFDYLLEYLVAEGYADTNAAAIKIMANMSEEWRESIVEEVLDEKKGERPRGLPYGPVGKKFRELTIPQRKAMLQRGKEHTRAAMNSSDEYSGSHAASSAINSALTNPRLGGRG
jgi:hypothetical protein